MELTSEKEERTREWGRVMDDLKALAKQLELGELLDVAAVGDRRPDGRSPLEGRVNELGELASARLRRLERETREAKEAHERDLKDLRRDTSEAERRLREKMKKLRERANEMKEREKQLKVRVRELVHVNENHKREINRRQNELEQTMDMSAEVGQKLKEQVERATRERDEWRAKEGAARSELRDERNLHDVRKRELAKRNDEYNQLRKESEERARLSQTRIDELQWQLDHVIVAPNASDHLQVGTLSFACSLARPFVHIAFLWWTTARR